MKPWRRLRACLYVPGIDERKLVKASGLTVDLAIVDLEDSVAADRKLEARELVSARLPSLAFASGLAVRVNGADTGLMTDDIAAVLAPNVDAVVIPKVEAESDLAEADQAIAAAERAHGIAAGTVWLLPLIETALGLVRCEHILETAPARTYTSLLGSGDLAADLALEVGADGEALHHARSRLAVATRAAGLARPVDGPWLALDDVEGLREDSRRSRALGYQGRGVLAPRQIDEVCAAYDAAPAAELHWARRAVAAFEEAEAAGKVSLSVDGRFVDYPVYKRAVALLESAGA